MTPAAQDKLVRRLQDEDSTAADRICASTRTNDLDDADVVVVSYGITSRVAQRAIEMAREQGLKVGQVAADHGLAVPGKHDSRTGADR